MILTANDKQRFLAYVFNVEPDRCWFWLGGTNLLGYGRFRLDSKTYLTHRIAYYLEYNIDPGNLCVCHHCDNPPCCNPRHLFLGTKRDNAQDAAKKGLAGIKLTCENVYEIRRLLSLSTPQVDIARMFNVSKTTITEIKTRSTWSFIRAQTSRRRKH